MSDMEAMNKPGASQKTDLGTWLVLIYFFASSAVLYCVAALICALTFWFDKNRRLTHYFACLWGFHYVAMNPFWRTTYEGRENIDPTKTYVLVANHQSYFDILLLYGLYKPFKFVSKEEIFKVPFIGGNMYLNEYVKIKRGNMASIKEMMQTCKSWIERGASVLLFPEGTRSETGELQAFRDGAFRLARECKVPVVPVVLVGSHEALPKGAKSVNFKVDITVRVLPPIDAGQFDSSAAMRDYVHKLMKDTLAEIRGQALTSTDSPSPAGL